MILDAEVFKLPAKLNALGASKFNFYLGGSRFFRCSEPLSDWDFLVQDQPGVVEWLAQQGFEREGGVEYTQPAIDDNTRGVYVLNDLHVQVHFDVQAARIARDILATHFPEEHKDVRGMPRSQMWKACFALIKQVRTIHSDDVLPLEF